MIQTKFTLNNRNPLANKLLAYFPLVEMSSLHTDYVGQSKGSNNTTTTYTAPSPIGQALYCPTGANNGFIVPAGVPRFSGSFSISLWCWTVGSASEKYIFNEWGTTTRNFLMEYDTSNRIACIVGNGSNLSDSTLTVTGNRAGLITHVVLVVDGVNHHVYVNGVLGATQAGSYSGGVTTVTRRIGWAFNDSSPLNGYVNNVGIWTRPLTQKEVHSLYIDRWQLLGQKQRTIFYAPAEVVGGFQAAWATRGSRVIGAGVH